MRLRRRIWVVNDNNCIRVRVGHLNVWLRVHAGMPRQLVDFGRADEGGDVGRRASNW
jgi:hypothetical protein